MTHRTRFFRHSPDDLRPVTQPTIRTVAVVGAGVIGRSWIHVFARAGCETRVFDPDPEQLARALEWARASAEEDEALRFVDAVTAFREAQAVRRCDTLEEALSGAGWVQESGPETLAVKQRIFAQLDGAADPGTILASSTSAHDMSRIADGLAGAGRCVVAHPVNPPHVIPMVEVLPGEGTRPEVLTASLAFLESVGQSPVQMNRYVSGFLLNRLQAALIREAVFLYESGAASAEAIDTVVREGLGLRWALLGPFGTGHTNADGGAGEYFRRYGDAYRELWRELEADPEFSGRTIEGIHEETEAMYGAGATAALCAWRDRLVRRIRALKDEDPPPGSSTPGSRS
ncbi:3-hydroxyacyl-CoA dehydrogenase NAD-binding domain-containing protein [Candidatus Palauibacter scopulicola]|uniref:3-hydroxyacyl-CoA dehydrogenase NAD-binding domain-containing protein n=1 Tax=Candidatus Palauibacter scopulicola TaxID=3056741 RepID=UPI0028730054|nr:3-hydroxyacyl-CoA dehydrogenase NAD-binding domain-containing protein [Candidatus Palauibacter scopulicola]